jgi:hypothetical protein
MKKKLLALLLSAAMIFSMTACSSKNAEESTATVTPTEAAAQDAAATQAPETQAIALDKSWPAEKVLIGFECFDTTDDQFLAIQKYYEYLEQYFNFEVIYSESIASAEDELKFIENCASAGAKAVIGYYNVSGAEAVQLCADKGLYYWGGADKAIIYDKFADNEYYLGGYDGGNADYDAGYAMAKALIDQGCEKLVYTSGGRDFGIDFFIDRSEGFYAAVEEAKAGNPNVEVVYDVSGWPGTDAFTADQTKVCDMEFDGLGCSFSAAVWFQPLSTVGKINSVKIATIGSVGDLYKDFVEGGIVSVLVYDNEEVTFGGAIPAILNAVSGNGTANRNNGKAANYKVNRWIITSADQYNAIYEKHNADEYYVTAEEVANCIVNFNPEASYATFEEVYCAKTLDESVGQ